MFGRVEGQYTTNGSEYRSRETTEVFSSFAAELGLEKLSRSSEILFFKIFSFISTCLMVPASNISKYLYIFFLRTF